MDEYSIRIHNMHNDGYECPSNSFYVDRRSPVGNPFSINSKNNRDCVCFWYEKWFNDRLKGDMTGNFGKYIDEMYGALIKFKVIHLYCWCAPKQCHAQTIKDYLLDRIKHEKKN